MSAEGTYVNTITDDEGKEIIELQDAAHIDSKTISSVSFSFQPGTDITDSLSKSNKKSPNVNADKKTGRTAYTPITCTYPNGETSSLVILDGCIVQYRQSLESDNSKNTYAQSYVCIGIPESYGNKIFKDAKKNSSLNIGMKNNNRHLEGYYWIDCNLEKLAPKDIWIVYVDDKGKDQGMHTTLAEILRDRKKSLKVIALVSISGSMSNNDENIPLDLKNGKYHLTIKPHEIYIIDDSDAIGPTLSDTQRRKKEVGSMSGKFRSSHEIAKYAMSRLNK